MPFRSEKQRRYLWATNPDIARRWAHEYPQKGKLPMYANDDAADKTKETKSKEETNMDAKKLNKTPASVNNADKSKLNKIAQELAAKFKVAGDKLIKVDMPDCEGPTYAGQNNCSDEIDFDVANEQQEDQQVIEKDPETAANSILQKLSSIIAPRLRQKIEDAIARREGRNSVKVPENPGFRRYNAAVSHIPPPIGHPANPVPPAQNLASAQPQNPTPLKPVGGGSNPRHNVINSYGPLALDGNINGNAAFGAKNSPDSSKIAGVTMDKFATRMRAPMCPCGCGEKVYRCRCPQTCVCRRPGQPCGKYQKKAAAVIASCVEKWAAKSPAWQRSAGKNEEGGLNAKGRASYNKSTGGNLKAPVTEKNPTGERKSRRASFCARMGGMKKKLTGKDTASDPDSRINKALRKWNC